jgi:hypothetical protein
VGHLLRFSGGSKLSFSMGDSGGFQWRIYGDFQRIFCDVSNSII